MSSTMRWKPCRKAGPRRRLPKRKQRLKPPRQNITKRSSNTLSTTTSGWKNSSWKLKQNEPRFSSFDCWRRRVRVNSRFRGLPARPCCARLLEKEARVGRKLLATGNGRCNLLNASPTPSRMHGSFAPLAAQMLAQTPPEALLATFAEMGLVCARRRKGAFIPTAARQERSSTRFALPANARALQPHAAHGSIRSVHCTAVFACRRMPAISGGAR